MIIILKNADFSADNIGRVNIGSELEEEVINYMELLTKYPVSKNNTFAQSLNVLYKTLVANGIWSKIKILNVPIMSSTVEESFVNMVGASEFTDFADNYSIDTLGKLVRINTPTEPVNLINVNDVSSNNICLFGVFNNGTQTGTQGLIGTGINTTFTSQINSIRTKNGIYIQVYANGTMIKGDNMNYTIADSGIMNEGAVVCSFKDSSVFYKDSLNDRTLLGENVSNSITKIAPLQATRTEEGATVSTAIYGCANALTKEEVSILYDALTSFINEWQ